MAINCINLVQVTCDICKTATIILKTWQDARKLDWAAPIDGAFQHCPECNKKRHDDIVREAKLAEIADKCSIVNQKE